MSVVLSRFVVNINRHDRTFTLEEVMTYFANDCRPQFANPDDVRKLREEYRGKFQAAVDKYSLKEGASLTASIPSGKELATLALEYENKVVELIVKGAARQGVIL